MGKSLIIILGCLVEKTKVQSSALAIITIALLLLTKLLCEYISSCVCIYNNLLVQAFTFRTQQQTNNE